MLTLYNIHQASCLPKEVLEMASVGQKIKGILHQYAP
jgi:hypothetical protein